MDIEKLIRRLRNDADAYRNGETLGRAFADQEDVLDNAATTIETLHADLARVTTERDAAVEELENYMVQDVVEGNEPCGICAKASNIPCECCDPKWRSIKKED